MTDSQFNTMVRLLQDTNTRIDKIDNDLSDIKTDLTDFKKSTETQFSSVKADISNLQTNMSSVKADISNLQTNMSSVKADIADLKSQMKKNSAVNSKEHQDIIDNMNSKFYDLSKTVKTIEEDLNTVFVSNKYEHDLFKKKLAINI